MNFDESFENQVGLAQASASEIGIFKARTLAGSAWGSGDQIYEVDVVSPVIRCVKAGFRDSDIVVDVILDEHKRLERVETDALNVYGIAGRTFELFEHYRKTNSVLRLHQGRPEVEVRSLLFPQSNIKKKEMPFQWSKKQVEAMYKKGKEESYKQILDEEDWENYFGDEDLI